MQNFNQFHCCSVGGEVVSRAVNSKQALPILMAEGLEMVGCGCFQRE